MKKQKTTWIFAVQLIISAVFFIGMLTFLKPCGPKEDGTFMSCHYAGTALIILSAGMLAISLLGLFLKDGAARTAVGALQFAFSVLALIIPGTVIGLCMMPEMRCRAVMRPGSIVFAVLMLLFSLAGILINRRKKP